MRSRRQAREAALQALYQCDTLGDWSSSAVELFFSNFYPQSEGRDGANPDYRAFSNQLVQGVAQHLEEIDKQLCVSAANGNLARMARVDRSLLRMCAFELLFCPDIPVLVSINEGIELAKVFGGDQSSQFVNGVLDDIARRLVIQKVA